MTQDLRRVSVIGLGKLGAPLAVCLSSKGFRVIGVDVDPQKLQSFAAGVTPSFEPGLETMLRSNRERLSVTEDYAEAVAVSDATFIVVPTPSDDQGLFSSTHVLGAARDIGEALKVKQGFHLVVVTSTVMPGTTANEILPTLEQHSGKRCGTDFGLCYNPEFLALGAAIDGLLEPDFLLIGESDPFSGQMLVGLYRRLCNNQPPSARMNFVNAEVAKLAVNTFVTTKISYANMLAELCDQLPGGDVDAVTSALGLDSRIGSKYMKGALGYGGPCFPRDNIAFIAMAKQLGMRAILPEATEELNRTQFTRLTRVVLSRLPSGGRVGILGLSYKPNTDVIEESQGLNLANHLADQGIPLVVYDPAAMGNARRYLDGTVTTYAPTAMECAAQADVVVVATPWEEFRTLKPSDLNHANGRPTIIDCWRILNRSDFEPSANYISLGTGDLSAEALGDAPLRLRGSGR